MTIAPFEIRKKAKLFAFESIITTFLKALDIKIFLYKYYKILVN